MYGRTTRGIPEAPTTDKYLGEVLDRVPVCDIHPGEKNDPCYKIQGDQAWVIHWAVCDARARKAGFVGEKKAPAEPQTKKQWVRLART